MRKFWNAARFAGPHLNAKIAELDPKELNFRPVDLWILSRLNRLIEQTTDWLDDFQFNRALGEIQTFVWHEFCDMYIEEVKHRLYGGDPTADAARYTLYHVILTATKLLAPFIPHFSEEVYQAHFAKDHPYPSVHASIWPDANKKFIDESAERTGEIANLIVSALRQFKSAHKMALSKELSSVEIYASSKEIAQHVTQAGDDIAGTMRVGKLNVKVGRPELAERILAVEPNLAKLGPRLRADAKLVLQALLEAKPEKLAKQLAKGKLELSAGGKQFELAPEDVRLIKETASAGHKVEVIDIQEPALTILISS